MVGVERRAGCGLALVLLSIVLSGCSATQQRTDEVTGLLQRARTLATQQLHSAANDAYRELWRLLEAQTESFRAAYWMVQAETLLWLGVTARRNHGADALEWLHRADAFHPSRDTKYHLAVSRAQSADLVGVAKDLSLCFTLGPPVDLDFDLVAVVLSGLGHWSLLDNLLNKCLQGACSTDTVARLRSSYDGVSVYCLFGA
jgi:hypothetical protein